MPKGISIIYFSINIFPSGSGGPATVSVPSVSSVAIIHVFFAAKKSSQAAADGAFSIHLCIVTCWRYIYSGVSNLCPLWQKVTE